MVVTESVEYEIDYDCDGSIELLVVTLISINQGLLLKIPIMMVKCYFDMKYYDGDNDSI